MKINNVFGVSSNRMPMEASQASQKVDAQTKSLQNQIANAQKQLQELAQNKEMSVSEKNQKRQELNQQIADLNSQLRQHQIEMKKEEQEAKKAALKKGAPNTEKQLNDNQDNTISETSMKAIMSAHTNIEQAKGHQKVATKMQGRAGVLEIEIKLDGSRGNGTDRKVEELGEVTRKGRKAITDQMGDLGKANKEIKKAQKEEKIEEKDKKAEENEKGEENKESTINNMSTEEVAKNKSEAKNTKEKIKYKRIDVRL